MNLTTRLSRLAAIERSRRAEAERLCDWFEARVTAGGTDFDPDHVSAIGTDLLARDPGPEARLIAAYTMLGWCTIRDGEVVMTQPPVAGS